MIKFRAWDKSKNKYFINGEDGRLDNMLCCDDWDMVDPNDYLWEQFTGLRDVNGKEIYVGDIAQPVSIHMNLKRGKPFEVNKDNYVYGKWIAKDISNNGFIVNGYYFGYEIQVAGNVHENPELLEEDK